MIEIATKYNQYGFACLPTLLNKQPATKESWNNGFSPERFSSAQGVGVICGSISGGLECLDFDNHFGDAKENLNTFLSFTQVRDIYEKYRLPIEKSQNGGFHLLYRCKKNEGNRKLAQRLNDKGRPEAIIETRGEGGYFVAYPTKGYIVVRNNIFDVKEITELERAVLIDHAVSMNEFTNKIIASEYETSERPGDKYNNESSSIDEAKKLLELAGWRQIDEFKWRRPGKDDGISATFGKVAANVFYCFTSNGHPFDNDKAYTPFQILSILKFNGDFKAAAQSLTDYHSKPVQVKKEQKTLSELSKILETSKIDLSRHIERPPVILSIREQSGTTSVLKRVFTLGNFSCIIGKAKSKKTFLISMFSAALLNNDAISKFTSELPAGKNNILYFDTEQGEYDSHNVIRRIQSLSGNTSRLFAYNLRPFSPMERCQLIEYAFEMMGASVGYCVIDGIADLAIGINDEDEATRVTTILLRLTKVYNCHITTVLHQNKNDNFATGHIGSAVMKKAEIVISVTKSKDAPNASDISNEMSRGVDFEPFQMVIDNEGMPFISQSVVRKKEPMTPSFASDGGGSTETEPPFEIPF